VGGLKTSQVGGIEDPVGGGIEDIADGEIEDPDERGDAGRTRGRRREDRPIRRMIKKRK